MHHDISTSLVELHTAYTFMMNMQHYLLTKYFSYFAQRKTILKSSVCIMKICLKERLDWRCQMYNTYRICTIVLPSV